MDIELRVGSMVKLGTVNNKILTQQDLDDIDNSIATYTPIVFTESYATTKFGMTAYLNEYGLGRYKRVFGTNNEFELTVWCNTGKQEVSIYFNGEYVASIFFVHQFQNVTKTLFGFDLN